jgi:hypothetical protein
MRSASPPSRFGQDPDQCATSHATAWMTENRGVPSSSLGLAIKDAPRERGGVRSVPLKLRVPHPDAQVAVDVSTKARDHARDPWTTHGTRMAAPR